LSLAVQPDGAIIAAGTASHDDGGLDFDFALTRFLPDGNLDPAFGSGGEVTSDFGPSNDEASWVVLQTDGSIIAVAQGLLLGNSSSDFALARYLPDGAPDLSFGVGGKLTTDFGGADYIEAMVLQSDGKLLAAGGGGPNQGFTVARFLTDAPI